eukprot:Gb_16188 [translate_table: standard]
MQHKSCLRAPVRSVAEQPHQVRGLCGTRSQLLCIHQVLLLGPTLW